VSDNKKKKGGEQAASTAPQKESKKARVVVPMPTAHAPSVRVIETPTENRKRINPRNVCVCFRLVSCWRNGSSFRESSALPNQTAQRCVSRFIRSNSTEKDSGASRTNATSHHGYYRTPYKQSVNVFFIWAMRCLVGWSCFSGNDSWWPNNESCFPSCTSLENTVDWTGLVGYLHRKGEVSNVFKHTKRNRSFHR